MLEILPAGTKPRTSHHRLPVGEAQREALDDLHQRDEKGPSSVRPTLKLFQRQCWGELLRDGVEHIQAFLSMQVPSWTELNWRDGDKHAGYLFTVIAVGGGGSQQSKFISTQNALCCSIANRILLHVVQLLHQSSETATVGPLSDTTALLILLFQFSASGSRGAPSEYASWPENKQKMSSKHFLCRICYVYAMSSKYFLCRICYVYAMSSKYFLCRICYVYAIDVQFLLQTRALQSAAMLFHSLPKKGKKMIGWWCKSLLRDTCSTHL